MAYDSGVGVTALKLACVQLCVVVVEVRPTAHTPQYVPAFRYIRVCVRPRAPGQHIPQSHTVASTSPSRVRGVVATAGRDSITCHVTTGKESIACEVRMALGDGR